MNNDETRSNENYIISAEYQVLKLCINNPTLLISFPDIQIDIFPHKEARDIFQSIVILIDNEEEISNLSLLREANKINDSIELDNIKRILSFEVSESSIPEALKLLKKESIKYKLSKKIGKLQEEISCIGSIDSDSIQNILWDSQQLILNSGDKVDSKKLEECIDDFEIDLRKRKEGNYHSFGDSFLDTNLTRLASGGQIILISAATGMGKSGYALNLINGMINLNVPSMYFSLEMDEISTMDRLLSLRTKIPIKEWYVKENISTLLTKVDKEKTLLLNKPFRLIDNPSISLSKMQSLIREFKTYYKTDYVCVYVDLITQVKEFIDLHNGGNNLASTIEKAVNKLNEIAKLENVCFVCIAQMNRTIDNSKITKVTDVEKFRPILGSIKNSGALAERSRVVLSVFRQRPYVEKYLPNAPELEYLRDIMEVSILKQNQGHTAIGTYLFDGPTMTTLPFIDEGDEHKF